MVGNFLHRKFSRTFTSPISTLGGTTLYGSDPFAYDFNAELAAAQEKARKREHDRDRLQALAEAEYWRRLAAGELYRPLTYGYGKPTKSKPVGKVIAVQPPTRQTLERHRVKLEPTGHPATEVTRRLHARAVDETADLCGLTADSLSLAAQDLRREGNDVPSIAEHLGITECKVKALLAA